MFSRFLESSECMKVLAWFINHPDNEYMGSVVCVDCGNPPIGRFMAAVTILEGVGVLNINDFEEELMLSLNKDSHLTQLILEVKTVFDDLGYVSQTVSSALYYLYSTEYSSLVDREVGGEVINWKEILDICEDYKNIDLSNEFNKQIYDICVELEENGEFNNFLNYVRNQVNNIK